MCCDQVGSRLGRADRRGVQGAQGANPADGVVLVGGLQRVHLDRLVIVQVEARPGRVAVEADRPYDAPRQPLTDEPILDPEVG